MVASWACEVTEILIQRGSEEDSLYEDYSDPTHTPNFQQNTRYIHMTVFVVCDTFQKIFFLHMCSYCIFLHFNCEMKMSVLL